MTETKHTAGPWTVEYDGLCDYNILDQTGLAVAVVVQNGFRSREETLANANVVSAASEMLEFLKWFHEEFREFEDAGPAGETYQSKELEHKLSEVSQIISKAEGRTQ